MANAHLVSQKVQEVHFVNKLEKSGQIQLQSSFNFNVNFSKDGQRCVARLYQSIKDPDGGETIFLSAELVGAFACEGVATDEDKKQVHTQCYDQLFPYAQTTITSLMAASGIPGFQLRKPRMDTDKVVVGQNPNQATQQPPKKPTLPIV